jgi:hypothetical protein
MLEENHDPPHQWTLIEEVGLPDEIVDYCRVYLNEN